MKSGTFVDLTKIHEKAKKNYEKLTFADFDHLKTPFLLILLR